MKIKTSELTGAALDWAVANCEGREPSHYKGVVRATAHPDCPNSPPIFGPVLNYSSDWSQGGPIVERERITWTGQSARICKFDGKNYTNTEVFGPTPLIAAMRCYVASKLGDEVEVPDSLFTPA